VADLATTDGGQAFEPRSFKSVPIWIGVGAADNNAADVPDAWDPFIGNDRLNRARAFTQALEELGANVSLHVFAKADHTFTDTMRSAGCDALAAALQ
jgi:acetyl esterase/lipase